MKMKWHWWRTDHGSSYATDVGLHVSRVSHYSSLHRLGHSFQFLCTRDVGVSHADRCRGQQTSTHADAPYRSVAVELSLAALRGDLNVDRLRALGGNAGVHV